MKILFITANRVGDAVLTTGLLFWLVNKYPTAKFTIACGPYGADIFRAVPRLERLIVMKKKKWNGHWLDLWLETIGTEWDIIIDMRNSIVSRILKAKKRAIHGSGTGKHKVIENAGIMALYPPPDPYIWITEGAAEAALRLLPTDRPILALGPAANWPLKQWPIEYFIELVKRLPSESDALKNASILVIADKHERDQILPLLRSIPDDRRIELIGKDLQTAAACLTKARLYIGNDSGLMHMSAALKTPTLGLFGPGFPHIYGPWGNRCAYVCTPESREELMAKAPEIVTPKDTLMGTLTVDSVVGAAKDLLEKTA